MRSRHSSDAEHSAVVVMGGYRDDGSVMPARDFFTDAIAQTDFEIKGDIQQGFIDINKGLHENIKGSITDKKWKWDRVTYRRNGEVADSPRNIVDTSELLDSQHWELL
jgi:hypothetical protein